tara:strand:+ start:382 stop:1458 length:1077 start_codon:yes stop_codon:yes gene_type:complete
MNLFSSVLALFSCFLVLGASAEPRTYYLSDSQWAHLAAGEVRLLERKSEESGGNLFDPLFAAGFMGSRLVEGGIPVSNVEFSSPYEMTVEATPEAHEKLAVVLEFLNQSVTAILIKTTVFAIPLELLADERLKFTTGDSPFSKVVVSGEEAAELRKTLQEIEGVDLLSAPTVTARSAQRAKVEVVRELVFPSEFDPPQIADEDAESEIPVVPAQPRAFESRNIGLTCNFSPRLELDGSINLDMAMDDTRFLGFVNYGSPISKAAKGKILRRPKAVVMTENRMEMPVFNTRRFEGSVRLPIGGNVIVGGMAHEEVVEVTEGREFPLIGKKRSWMDSTKSALFFLINVSVVDAGGKPVKP